LYSSAAALVYGLQSVHVQAVNECFDPNGPDCQGEMGDMYFTKGTACAARIAAGSVILACERVMQGLYQNAFAIVRPPGHHAEVGCMYGFCFFNNAAVAAAAALDSGMAERVLVLDWDVHHCNGTQNIFYSRKDVMVISLHRYGNGFYPGTGALAEVGEGEGVGYNINVPWPGKGFAGSDYMAAFDLVVLPIAQEFNPDLVIVSAGFDAAQGDPLGGMKVTPTYYGYFTTQLMQSLAGGKVVVALEGGYAEQVIATCTESVVHALLGRSGRAPKGAGARRFKGETREMLQEVAQAHSPYWRCMSQEDFGERVETYFEGATLTPNSKLKDEANSFFISVTPGGEKAGDKSSRAGRKKYFQRIEDHDFEVDTGRGQTPEIGEKTCDKEGPREEEPASAYSGVLQVQSSGGTSSDTSVEQAEVGDGHRSEEFSSAVGGIVRRIR